MKPEGLKYKDSQDKQNNGLLSPYSTQLAFLFSVVEFESSNANQAV